MSDKYYIKIQIDESKNASSKAVNDCNQILDNNGVKPYYLKIKKPVSYTHLRAHET
mgnify:CR=1 FL=1